MRHWPTTELLTRCSLLAIIVVGFPALGSCGLFDSPCNDLCEFLSECASDSCTDVDDERRCLDACKHADDQLNESEREVLEECGACLDELGDDQCDVACEPCDELVAAASDFIETLFEELGGGYCYDYYDYGYDY